LKGSPRNRGNATVIGTLSIPSLLEIAMIAQQDRLKSPVLIVADTQNVRGRT
jgi:hypothetical protein